MTDRSEAMIDRFGEAPLRQHFSKSWRLSIALAVLLSALLLALLVHTSSAGIGVWGTSIPFVWGFDLANYAWWIGVANGTSLLATLLVLWRSPLRVATNRFAETMALAAAVCAAIFPVVHLGKPWLAYWMAPYPAHTGLWPQPLSPLTWDFWGILTHLIAVALFWFVGLIPDLANLRDRARPGWRRKAYGLFALGWRGTAEQWVLHARTHRLLALSVIPFLFVMQTVVALELAVTIVPDWHDTALPVRFVVEGWALGVAVAYFFAAIFRRGFDPESGREMLDDLGRILLVASLIAAFVVGLTTLIGWLGPSGEDTAIQRWTTGEGAWLSWTSIMLSKLAPQLLWFRRMRLSALVSGTVALCAMVGVWFDFLAVMVIGLIEGRLIRPEVLYSPSFVEFALLAGSIGLFALFALVFVRNLPVVSLYESRSDTSGAA